MEQQQLTSNDTHNLFLSKFINNEQTKHVVLMKLDTHRTLYKQGVQSKYLMNLVIAGRNFVEIFGIFQKQIVLNMGNYHIYEDIEQICQWDKNIVMQAGHNKIIGLVYEDCILKNSFMLSLQFLDLAPKQPINITCDRYGYYMAVVTSRQILLCVSQKTIQKYKAKPLYHRNSVIISQDIKWNRTEYQSISDVIRIQHYDFDLSKIECINFCDDKLYFVGYSSKSNNQKFLYYISPAAIFSDDENKPLIYNISKQFLDVRQIYPIHRGKESQFLIVRQDGVIQIQSQKGNTVIENENKFKSTNAIYSKPKILCRNHNAFPFYVLFNNVLYIYKRENGGYEGNQTITTASQIYKNSLKLSTNIQVNSYDIRDNLMAYCNNYEVGILKLQNTEQQMMLTQLKKNQHTERIVVKQSFGRIIDFSIGRNCIVIENYHGNLCRINFLSKSIRQDPRPFVMHARKNTLETLPKIKFIRTLSQFVSKKYFQSEEHYKSVLKNISQLMVIGYSDNSQSLCKINEKGEYQCLLAKFKFYTVLPEKYITKNNQALIFMTWFQDNSKILLHLIGKKQNKIELLKQISDITFQSVQCIKNIGQYVVQPSNSEFALKFFNLNTEHQFSIKLSEQKINQKSLMQISKKNITFKKKDKDFIFLQVTGISQSNCLYIWEISIATQQFKLSHRTEDIAEGLPVLFNSSLISKNSAFNSMCLPYRFRSITCPQYTIPAHNISSSQYMSSKIVGMHFYEYGGQVYFLLVNNNNTLMVYKKIYNSNSSSGAQSVPFNSISHSDIGFLWHRIPIQLDILKKWEYDSSKNFVDLGCGILRVSNFAFFKGQFFILPQDVVSCFQMDGQTWYLDSNTKIRMLITKGRIVSHFLVTEINSELTQEILGIQSTNQIYVVYSRSSFQVFNKQLNSIWKLNETQFGNRQIILCICAFDHYIAVSYYNYAEDQQNLSEYQSIRFKLRIYNTMIKNKTVQKQRALEQPALFIRYIPPDKLLLVTPSNIFIYQIKNQRTLQTFRHKNYTKRSMLSSFGYIPQKIGIQPGYMVFGGFYGGLSFMLGKWIDKQKLDQIWFESIKCSIKELQIFHYGQNERDYLKAIIADNQCNIIIFDLKPKKAEKIADFNLGSQILKIKKRNEVAYIASEDGCLSILIPLRLKNIQISYLDFQEEILKQIPFLGGLNTRDSRCLSQKFRTYKITSKGNVLDSQIIQDFMSLTQTLQNHIFDKIDMQLEDIKSAILSGI